MPHQTKEGQEPVPLILRPAVAAVNLGAKAVSAFTGVPADRVKKTAGNILRGEKRSVETLKEELLLANKLIMQLEGQLIQSSGSEIAMTADLIKDTLAHAIPPSLESEYNIEKQLLNLLQDRLNDTELAEEYKKAAGEQEAYFAGVIESLQEDFRKELAVVENQENDKANLERVVASCRNTIDKLKEELERQTKARETDLREQKTRYKSQQSRISNEIRAATDFCRDLRRKLDAEVELSKGLFEKNDALLHELEALKRLSDDNFVRLQSLATEVQEQRHKIALLNQERQRASEASKDQITKLREQVKIVEDRITIIEEKGADKLAAQLKKINEEKNVIISKYESDVKALEEEAESELSKYLEEYKINATTVDQLKEKDTADVEKEQKKANGEYRKLNNIHEHAVKRLQSKLVKLQNEVATTAKLATVLRDQVEFEKQSVTRQEGRAAGLRGDLLIEQQRNAVLREKLASFEKDLQRERDNSAKQLELARNSILEQYETQSKVIVATFENEKKRIDEELQIQIKVAAEAARRLTETRKELEGQTYLLMNDIKEFAGRKLAAEEAAKKAEVKLDEMTTLVRTTKLDVSNWEQMAKEEKLRSTSAEKKLNAEIRKTKDASNLDHDKVSELESELHSSKSFVRALQEEVKKEEAAKKKIEEEKGRLTNELTRQIAQLQEEIERVRAETEENRNTALRFEVEVRKSQATNSHLKTKVDAQNQVREKDAFEIKEVHNIEVQVVERN